MTTPGEYRTLCDWLRKRGWTITRTAADGYSSLAQSSDNAPLVDVRDAVLAQVVSEERKTQEKKP